MGDEACGGGECVCVCAEEAAGAGGGWEEAFAARPTKKLCRSGLLVSSKKKYLHRQRVRVATHCSAQVFARCEWAQ